jgi:glycosyltransferase involved in cell wall biosynthesis
MLAHERQREHGALWYRLVRISPATADIAIVSFEGPDPYSTVGGLATRVSDLGPVLVERGYAVTHLFVGDPELPHIEDRLDGKLRLVRWSQWISRYHRKDVYDGEWGKWRDFSASAPTYLLDHVVAPARERGRRTVLLFEDWQTAEAAQNVGESSYVGGLGAVCLWNANNTYGVHNVEFARLSLTVQVTTVSRWMRTQLQPFGVPDALVVSNGIAVRYVAPIPPGDLGLLRRAKGDVLTFVKVARFDPDKRWMNAIDAIATLKARGERARFLFRGSRSPYRDEVLARFQGRGLSVATLRLEPDATPRDFAGALASATDDALFLDFFLSERLLRGLYATADGVLANSEREPFGLVGLEVMGAGGIPYVGVTGEDYAQPLGNCVVVRTDDPREIAEGAVFLRERPELAHRIRAEGRQTARRYAWPRVVEDMELVWDFAAERTADVSGPAR